MNMLIHKLVDIRRSELCIIRKAVAQWELPILEAMHEGITVHDGEQLLDREPPEASGEYMRLETLYKNTTNDNGDQGIPYVASVYGQHAAGINALRKAIEAATVSSIVDEDDLIGEISAGE
jgi:hypothetical protein